jgi:hypothetical protein
MSNLPIAPSDLTGKEGEALAAGRLVATVVSSRTGRHITVRLTCKRPPIGPEKRWRVCPFEEATRVFVDIPGAAFEAGESPGVFFVATGTFKSTRGADRARVWAALFALRVASGKEPSAKASIVQSTHCLHCGRELTDPESVERGIGPECFGKVTASRHQRRSVTDTIGTAAVLKQTSMKVGV